jgi:hypothetical protein
MQNGWNGSRGRMKDFKNVLESSISADLKNVGGNTLERVLVCGILIQNSVQLHLTPPSMFSILASTQAILLLEYSI